MEDDGPPFYSMNGGTNLLIGKVRAVCSLMVCEMHGFPSDKSTGFKLCTVDGNIALPVLIAELLTGIGV